MVRKNLNIWLIGDGSNRIHFIYSLDLIMAIKECLNLKGKHLFNIGSDNVRSLKYVFQELLLHAKSNKKINNSLKFHPRIFGEASVVIFVAVAPSCTVYILFTL